MPIDVSAFINPLTFCEVEVEIADETNHLMVQETVKLGYYRNRYTAALQARVQNFFESPNDLPEDAYKDMLYPVFLQMVGWWDVRRGEATCPLTTEDIQPIALQYIIALLFGVLNQARMGVPGEATRGPQKPAPSSATSAPAAETTSSQTGATPQNSIISISPKASHRSSPGNGSKRRTTTTNARSSGARRASS